MGRPRVLIALCLLAGLSWGCFAPSSTVRHYRVRPVPARAIVRAACAQLGERYAWGGCSPNTGFDCSGLVYWCYSEYGSLLPRTARELFRIGVPVSRRELRAGDLVFFNTTGGPRQPSHVGIMLSHDRFIHAPASGELVREDELSNNYWKRTYYGARRID